METKVCASCKEKKPIECFSRNKGEKDGYIPENIIPACVSCNSSKQEYDFLEWYRKQPFYSEAREKRIIEYCEMARQHREGRESDGLCNA